MKIEVRAFGHSTEPGVLATVRIKLTVASENLSIVDAHIVLEPHGKLRLVMPYVRGYNSLPAVILGPSLRRAVEDVVFSAFYQRVHEDFMRAVEDGVLSPYEGHGTYATADTPGATGPRVASGRFPSDRVR
jgi:hypothetical protein